ncbi:hypothetical protein ND861_14795 [Leptospira sp. 2 VSF19]|nr:hypothetical protein [Leptospira soteropolitanensis]MCW7501478.1 hypothetical protein [Leptospira soteropolitanensis]MCW7527623.1 hypothetical protein [Leptospira soteropolitanensis]
MITNKLEELYKSPFSFLFLYLFLYGFHCIWNWSEFMSFNRSLELDAIHSGKQISLWSLYPFQIVIVLLVFVLYWFISFSIIFFFSLGETNKEIFRTKNLPFFMSLVRQFFLFVCLLFVGNQILGLLQYLEFYSVLVVLFWFSLFLLFIIKNGDLYRRLFVSADHSTSFLSHSLGYVNPIVCVFVVLALANV